MDINASQLEERLIDLEVKAAFQEELLDTLNDIVTRQQQQLDLLQKQFQALYQQVLSHGATGAEKSDPRSEIPPHY